jgi:hypothetical protein
VVRPSSPGKADLIGEKMGILTRFFGKEPQADDRGGDLVANRKTRHPLSLQVLFKEKFTPDAGRLTEAMRSYHISMKRARFEIDPGLLERGTVIGLAGWGKHTVQLVGFDGPMPADAVERCVAPLHYGQELKAQVRRHASHVLRPQSRPPATRCRSAMRSSFAFERRRKPKHSWGTTVTCWWLRSWDGTI